MQKPQITAYLKTYCGWSAGVRAVLSKYNLPYTEKDIIANPAFRWEMETKSGQSLSPCVEINDKMLSDVSGEEVEQYLIEAGVVQPSEAMTDVPLNAPCATARQQRAGELLIAQPDLYCRAIIMLASFTSDSASEEQRLPTLSFGSPATLS
jgi:glutaredoxin